MNIRLKMVGASVCAAALLSAGSVAFAEESGTGAPSVPPPPRPALEQHKGEMRPVNRVASTTREGIRDRREGAREEMHERVKENMQERHDKVREHLGEIKDKKKQEMAQNLSEKFDKTNKEWTDRFTKQLDRLDTVMVKIEGHAGTTDSTDALQKAKDAIAAARTAVATQAAKTYTVDTSTLPTVATSTDSGQEKIMQGLRKSFKSLQTGLFKDLFALRDGVMKDARKAVEAAARTLGGSPGEKHETSAEPITP